MALPILMFDQEALSPRFGYVFQRRWVQPYESLVGILWKFARMNLLSGATLVTHLRTEPLDPYKGVGPAEVDLKAVARMLGVTQRSVRVGMATGALEPGRWLRYCPRCMSLGYHGVIHQRERHARCPIHHLPLLTACGHCGRKSAYWLDAQLLDAPFRCRHCRRYYGSKSGPPRPFTSLSRERRIAVTRAALGAA
jgi:hypothetical protein